MAKITCPECLSLVDEEESFCPNCGHLLVDDVDDEVRYYAEEKTWTFGNTLIALLLALLIAALGVFLYLNGLKWPYDDAMKYYTDEKIAYEQQVSEYKEIPPLIRAANDELEAKIDELRRVLNSGDEPADPSTVTAANDAIRRAQEQRAEVPEIAAAPAPSPAKDSIFDAKEIRETGRVIDQMRYSLYQQYGDLTVPDYTAVFEQLERARSTVQGSILLRKQGEGVTPRLKELLDRYQSFMDEYISFMADYDRGDKDQIRKAGDYQAEYVSLLKELRAVDTSLLPELDESYFTAVTQMVERRLTDHEIPEPTDAS